MAVKYTLPGTNLQIDFDDIEPWKEVDLCLYIQQLPTATEALRKVRHVIAHAKHRRAQLSLFLAGDLTDDSIDNMGPKMEALDYFLRDWNLRLELYKELAALEEQPQTSQQVKPQEIIPTDIQSDGQPKKGRLAVKQCILVLKQLFDAAREGNSQPANTEIARAISALTGYDEETIRQRLSDKNSSAKDVAAAQDFFRQIGLAELADKLEKEKK